MGPNPALAELNASPPNCEGLSAPDMSPEPFIALSPELNKLPAAPALATGKLNKASSDPGPAPVNKLGGIA